MRMMKPVTAVVALALVACGTSPGRSIGPTRLASPSPTGSIVAEVASEYVALRS